MREEQPTLTGTILKVYVYLLTCNRPVGPREITRALNLSSPSLAYYHLRRLEELGLVTKKADGYVAVPGARIEGFISLGRKLVPRLLFYSAFYLGLVIVETAAIIMNLMFEGTVNMFLIVLFIITFLSFTIFLAEGILAYRKIKY